MVTLTGTLPVQMQIFGLFAAILLFVGDIGLPVLAALVALAP